MKKETLFKIIVILSLVLLGVVLRLAPHPWNFTPLPAIALALSAYFGWRYSAGAVIAMMLLSDILIGFYELPIMLSVYGSLLLAGFLGTMIERKKVGTILFATLGTSLSFFFITNWAVWQFGTMYSHTFTGLIESYIMALPFFKNSLMGDLFYTGVIFGTFEAFIYLKERFTQTSLETSTTRSDSNF